MQIKRKSDTVGIFLALIAVVILSLGFSFLKSIEFERQSLNFKFDPRVHIRAFTEKTFDLAGSGKTSVEGKPGYSSFDLISNFTRALIVERSFPVSASELELNIGFEEWRSINKDRNKALIKGVNRGAKWVPISLVINGKEVKGEIKLKGNTGDHWFWPERWSLRLKLKNGHTFNGMQEFSIQRPATRQFPADYLFQKWHHSIGGIVPRFSFARVKINGKNQGLMLLEEALSSHMIELAERKESPIFKLISSASEGGYFYSANRKIERRLLPRHFYDTRSIELVQSRKHSFDERMMTLFSYAHGQIMGLETDFYSTESLFDLEANIKPLLLSQIWGSGHTLAYQNTRFYLNPYTLLIEPITSDQTKLVKIEKINSQALSRILTKNPENLKLAKSVLRSAKKTMPNLIVWHREVCLMFPIDCPTFDENIIKHNFEILSKYVDSINPSSSRLIQQDSAKKPYTRLNFFKSSNENKIDYPEHIKAVHFNNGKLKIYNYLGVEVKIDSVAIDCSEEQKFTTPHDCRFHGVSSSLPPSVDQDRLSSIEIETNIQKLTKSKIIQIVSSVGGVKKETKVNFTVLEDIHNPILLKNNQMSFSNFGSMIIVEDSTYVIQSGDWEITSPIVFPPNSNVFIEPGTILRFSKNSYLLIRGALIAAGTEHSPIEFLPKEKFWKGIYVLSSKKSSHLDHVKFQGTSGVEDGALLLTGGVTFYQSDVHIDNSMFLESSSEDALNIVDSNFVISDSSFIDTLSDAFDSDFSRGSVLNVDFHDVKGDGLDLAGSQVNASEIFCRNILDKCISVGELSQLHAKNVEVENAQISIASKDGSIAVIDGIKVNNKFNNKAMAYIKKDAYGSPKLFMSNTNLTARQIVCIHGSEVKYDNKICKTN